jgi:hypothetical protein
VIAVKTAIGQARGLEHICSTASKPSQRRQTAIGFGIVDIFKSVDKADPYALGEPGERVGEGIRSRPSDLIEERGQLSRMAGADQPEAAVFGGAEDEIVSAEEAEGGPHLAGAQRRDVGTHEHHRARPGAHGSPHARAEIAAALTGGLDAAMPEASPPAGDVRRHGDLQSPASVFREPAQQPRNHQPLKAQRRDIADVAREPTLAAPEKRRSDEQNETAAHQPYNRMIRCGGTPAK